MLNSTRSASNWGAFAYADQIVYGNLVPQGRTGTWGSGTDWAALLVEPSGVFWADGTFWTDTLPSDDGSQTNINTRTGD